MTENVETSEVTPLNVVITAAESGPGLQLVRAAVANGHQVFGTTQEGSAGAFAIREAGGIPIYPEHHRELSVRSNLLMARADVVVHLAGAVAVNSMPFLPVDYTTKLDMLRATDVLMAAAGQTGVKRFIHISAAYSYGNTGDEAATEDAQIRTNNALLKAIADAEDAVLDGGLPGYVLRAGYIYGGHSASNDGVIEAIRTGRPLATGSGAAPFIHQDDLVSAIIALIEQSSENEGVADLLNIVDDSSTAFDAVLKLLGEEIGINPQRLSGLRAERTIKPEQAALLNMHTTVDNSKAKDALNWSPEYTSLAQGIERMMLIWRTEEIGDMAKALDTVQP